MSLISQLGTLPPLSVFPLMSGLDPFEGFFPFRSMGFGRGFDHPFADTILGDLGFSHGLFGMLQTALTGEHRQALQDWHLDKPVGRYDPTKLVVTPSTNEQPKTIEGTINGRDTQMTTVDKSISQSLIRPDFLTTFFSNPAFGSLLTSPLFAFDMGSFMPSGITPARFNSTWDQGNGGKGANETDLWNTGIVELPDGNGFSMAKGMKSYTRFINGKEIPLGSDVDAQAPGSFASKDFRFVTPDRPGKVLGEVDTAADLETLAATKTIEPEASGTSAAGTKFAGSSSPSGMVLGEVKDGTDIWSLPTPDTANSEQTTTAKTVSSEVVKPVESTSSSPKKADSSIPAVATAPVSLESQALAKRTAADRSLNFDSTKESTAPTQSSPSEAQSPAVKSKFEAMRKEDEASEAEVTHNLESLT